MTIDAWIEFEYRRQHAHNKLNWHVPPELRAGNFLDIGCGIGNGVIAALQHGSCMAVGIDRDFQEFPWFPPSKFYEAVDRYKVDRRKALFIEADIFQTNFLSDTFDVVFMLDSIEHVPNPDAFIQYAARCLSPNGVFVLDTCPLYYSPVGHHLFNNIPRELYPWAHLRKDFAEIVETYKVSDWSMQRFLELNRVTHAEIRQSIENAGLTVIQEERGAGTPDLMMLLDEHRDHLNLTGVDEQWLFEDWVLLVARKPVSS